MYKSFLLFLIISLSFASSSLQDKSFPKLFPKPIPLSSSSSFKTIQSAKANTLEWKECGGIYYENTNYNGYTSWTFKKRDTVFYNSSKQVLKKKSSAAASGWDSDSLLSMDSLVYQDGKLVEEVILDYEYNGGARSVYNSLNDGKIFVQTDYNWNYETKSWVPESKDSLVYSTPVNFDGHLNRYTTDLLSEYTYNYHNLKWFCSNIFAIEITECNATTLVVKKTMFSDEGTDPLDFKLIYKFRSTDWTEKNLSELLIQEKSSVSESYYDIYKSVYDENARYDYQKDRNDTFVLIEKHFSYKDTHLNDTLTLDLFYNGITWDTSAYRYKLIYDSNGNNIISIHSFLDTSTGNWRMQGKYVSYYSQMSSHVVHSVLSPSFEDFSITFSSSAIHFFAPDIQGVDLYDIKGCRVGSIRQQASSVLTIGTAGSAL